MNLPKTISLSDILSARNRIKDVVCHTPLKPSFTLNEETGKNVWLKLENMQPTGSFKIRGAANKILSLPREKLASGVVTASSGNHGRAVAYMARKLGIKATVCMTEIAPREKIQKIKDMGGSVVIHGQDQGVATNTALSLTKEENATFVPAFDDPEVIAGQGTIGLEILEENPAIDTLIVQVSGGGLMSGIALAARSIKPGLRIIGVTSEKGAAIYESIKAGRIVEVDEPVSIADALPGPIPADNQYTFSMCRDLVDEIIPVSDKQIASAMTFALHEEKIILEGGGAAGIALLRDISPEKLGQNIAVVCSGNNIDASRVIDLPKIDEYG